MLTHRGSERGHRGVEILRLATEHDQVVVMAQVLGQHAGRITQRDIPARAADDEPGLPQLIGPPRPDEEGDVAAGLQQPPAEITAGRAGPHHQNAHVDLAVVDKHCICSGCICNS